MSRIGWEFVSLQHLRWQRGYPETLILLRRGGRIKTETIKGIWTAEQLGFASAQATAERSPPSTSALSAGSTGDA